MMRRWFVWLVNAVLTLTFAGTAAAQAVDCPELVQKSLSAADQACLGLGRNQACYGNIALKAEPQSGITSLIFESPGDKANVADIHSMELATMNASAGVWGIALMNIQANIPDTLPGQGVTFLLFGDVQITNAADSAAPPAPVTLPVSSANTINVRSGPSRDVAAIGSLPAGQATQADGRNQAGDWLRIQLPDGGSGWVFAELVTVEGDPMTLAVVDASAPTSADASQAVYGPMQAFYFKTGLGDRPCEQAPDSGILIQTPAGAGKIELVMNGVQVSLGSTAYVQAQPSRDMVVSVVEGQATVSAAEKSVTVPAGSQVAVPMDADLNPAGAPGDPQPYDGAALASLPVRRLPRQVEVTPPLTPDQLAALSLPVAAGRYRFSASQATGSPPEACMILTADTAEFTIEALPGGNLTFGQFPTPNPTMVTIPGVGTMPGVSLGIPITMIWYTVAVTEGPGSYSGVSFSKLAEFPATMGPMGAVMGQMAAGMMGGIDDSGASLDMTIGPDGATGTLTVADVCSQSFTIERIGD